MLKKHIAACLVTTALLAAPALAQTSSGSSGSSGAASSSAASGKFMTEEKPNQWRASKLVGVNVYGPNNEKVGDVNEVLIDRNGKAEAVVIGVGGFLGIGEKDVALPFDQVQWSDQPAANRSASGGSGSGGGGAGGGAAGTTGSTGTTTGSTGSTASSAGGTSASSGSASSSQNRGYPDHGMITMSKDELKNAPSFRYAGNTSRDNNAGGNRSGAGTGGAAGTGMGATGSGAGGAAGTGAGTAPRQ